MLRSMYAGISGMRNFQTKLDVIGNNIANVNTFGFKKGRVTFKDTMNQTISGASASQANRGGKNPMQVGLGATSATIDTVHTNASLQTTGRSLDLGIDGDGFFIVKQGNAQYFTRAGNFYLDDFGNIVNGDGFKLQAYTTDVNGISTGQYEDVMVNVNAVLPATATLKSTYGSNLSKDAAIDSTYNQQITVVDQKGQQHRVDVDFTKKSATTWEVKLPTGPTTNTTFTLNFDAATGNYTSRTPTTAWSYTPEGGTAFNINLDLAGLKQEAGPTTALVKPDGNTEGTLESFNIGSDGSINGVYSNGLVRKLGIVALAKFSNPSGLSKSGSNLFQETINSGTANIDVPGQGRGSLSSGTLEMSNVDLSEEFTEMITAQRGFQANTKIITTSDEILQELVNLKR